MLSPRWSIGQQSVMVQKEHTCAPLPCRSELGFLPTAWKADDDHGWRALWDVCHAVRAVN
ncbi:hypothetical protein PAL_GLEAN10008691 [Pteropus alecto]|uniref:Uncharacterized protein n=1 Tax=Pteropus alecto TaxID=9402 RepID=L5KSK5_PTEAL|nr:hypothetical protein PAL_GLEAN10008691 [Pteropus alecto]